MLQTPQVVFHGISRSPAVEAAINEKVEALTKFDSRLGAVRVDKSFTITQFTFPASISVVIRLNSGRSKFPPEYPSSTYISKI